MSLSPGVRLGSYEATARIGAGGMGEVYQARDTKLDRDERKPSTETSPCLCSFCVRPAPERP